MALSSETRLKSARGIGGGILSGLNESLEADNKNRFARNKTNDDRRFQEAKMMAQDMLARNRQKEQNQFSQQNRMDYLKLQDEMARKRDADQDASNVDPNMLSAMTTGKFTPAMIEKLGELSLDDQIAVLKNMAQQKGFVPTGEREVETGEKEGGFLGMGQRPVKRKVPVYSQKNQFQR